MAATKTSKTNRRSLKSIEKTHPFPDARYNAACWIVDDTTGEKLAQIFNTPEGWRARDGRVEKRTFPFFASAYDYVKRATR